MSVELNCVSIENSHTASAVKESVSSLDGVVDSVGAGIVVDLP